MNPLSDITFAVNVVRTVTDGKARIAKINEILAGDFDFKVAAGRALSHRRALFCTRLAQEGLWPGRN